MFYLNQVSKKLVVSLAALFLAISLFTGTSWGASEKLCISVWDLNNPYWVNLVNGARERSSELGIELIVNEASNDVSKQQAAIENFVTIGCKAIIIAAVDVAAAADPLREAQKAGIKVIAQSMEIQGMDVWASADEFDMGYTIGVEAGKWIKTKLNGQGQVLVLGDPRQPQMKARSEGIIEGVLEHAPAAKVISQGWGGDTARSMSVTESVLQANPALKVVAAINDAAALGALAAVEASGRNTQDMFIGGIDATPEARAKINSGTAFRASVDNVPFANGRQDVDIALKLIAGEKLDYRQVIPVFAYDGE